MDKQNEEIARSQCKEALTNRNLNINLCLSCRRSKSCKDKASAYSGKRIIYCQYYKVKTISKEANQ